MSSRPVNSHLFFFSFTLHEPFAIHLRRLVFHLAGSLPKCQVLVNLRWFVIQLKKKQPEFQDATPKTISKIYFLNWKLTVVRNIVSTISKLIHKFSSSAVSAEFPQARVLSATSSWIHTTRKQFVKANSFVVQNKTMRKRNGDFEEQNWFQGNLHKFEINLTALNKVSES